MLQPIKLYYSVQNGGDGSACPIFFLSKESADKHQEMMSEGWGEPCTGEIDSYEGSTTYMEAIDSEADLLEEIAEYERQENAEEEDE